MVLVIVAIIMAIAMGALTNAKGGVQPQRVSANGGIVWRAISNWRAEVGGGLLPATNLVAGSNGSRLVDAEGTSYLKAWPTDSDNRPIVVTVGTASAPPLTGTPNTLAYRVSGGGANGWIAGYGPTGRIVFRRVVASTVADVGTGPIG